MICKHSHYPAQQISLLFVHPALVLSNLWGKSNSFLSLPGINSHNCIYAAAAITVDIYVMHLWSSKASKNPGEVRKGHRDQGRKGQRAHQRVQGRAGCEAHTAGGQPGAGAALRASQCAFVFFWGIIPGSISSQVGKRGSLAVLCNAQTPLGLEWASGCFLEGLMKALASSPAWWMRGM